MNSFAQAWLEAAKDLGIRVEHPYTFVTNGGISVTTEGVYLPNFGSENGTLLTCRFDSDDVLDAGDDTDFYQSWLNPESYEPYERQLYIETLDDWGWFAKESPPVWYSGKPWSA